MVRFGPAGSSDSFAEMGYKSTLDMPEYLVKMGLNAFEYQCGRGVRISTAMAEELGARSRRAGIALSIHAPYYISLSGSEEDKRLKSVDYILQTARAAKDMGADRIVVHSGSVGKMSRGEALALAVQTIKLAQDALDEGGYEDIHMCPETMGKVNQLGTLEEVLELCDVDERMIPCLDFGHLNARSFGGLKGYDDYKSLFEKIENKLGLERLRRFHGHFSKIAYTVPGGEKVHLTFADKEYGPEFEPLARLIWQYNCSPVIICESAGTQAEDAVAMQKMLNKSKEEHHEYE